ncbi:hypothetical protein E2C01_025703 [Portunus trituberculatus]|uniref:Uncharacterized protein n=1 Tax=Portunus trituberculatus TaxID=210409 RepID=A0A5B7EH63_PORTR|nr:hypothetical protein [Portunus trituberculatus]
MLSSGTFQLSSHLSTQQLTTLLITPRLTTGLNVTTLMGELAPLSHSVLKMRSLPCLPPPASPPQTPRHPEYSRQIMPSKE